jgi:hypothetical protein
VRGDGHARERSDLVCWISGHALMHPAVLLGVVLLLLNDHVLKARFPSFWTGKLSDFAGLFFFPFLVIPALALALGPLRLSPSRLADLGFGLTALSFAALKFSPPLNAAIATIVSALLGRPAVFALDPLRWDRADRVDPFPLALEAHCPEGAGRSRCSAPLGLGRLDPGYDCFPRYPSMPAAAFCAPHSSAGGSDLCRPKRRFPDLGRQCG